MTLQYSRFYVWEAVARG